MLVYKILISWTKIVNDLSTVTVLTLLSGDKFVEYQSKDTL